MAQVNGVPESTESTCWRSSTSSAVRTTEPHYPVGWAWAGNAPFQWGKRIASHLGGTRDPMVVSWPRRIKDAGGVRYQFEDVTDVAPTILDAAGLPEPVEVDGVKQQRVDGMSFLATFASASVPQQARHAIFRDAGQSRYLSRWLDGRRAQRPTAMDILRRRRKP